MFLLSAGLLARIQGANHNRQVQHCAAKIQT